MIRILVLAAAALLSSGGTVAAQVAPAERPVLRSQVTVNGDVVRIGDLIDHAGIVAHVPIFRAPDLGATGTVPVERVVEAVRAHAIVGLDTAGISEIAVTRASRAFPASAIEATIANALAAQYSLGSAKDILLNVERELRTVHAEPSVKGEPRIARLYFDPRSGRFDATVEIPGHNALRVNGRAVATVEVVTLARPIARGEVLKHADLVVERRARAEVGNAVVVDIEQATGQSARNALQAGRPLRTADLMKPEVIQRNEFVTLIFEVPGIVLSVRGKALEGGVEGDTITVLNEQSKRTVQGTIVGPGRVFVGQTPARLSAGSETIKTAANESTAR